MVKAETITSAANPLIKDVRRAIARGGLTEQGWCVAETFHLLEEALRGDCEVMVVLADERARAAAEALMKRLNGVKLAVLPDALFQSMAGTETTQGVIALVKPPEWKLEQLFGGLPLLVVLDGVQDPGNAGAIARAAEGVRRQRHAVDERHGEPMESQGAARGGGGRYSACPFCMGWMRRRCRRRCGRTTWICSPGVPAGSNGTVKPLPSIDLTGRCALIIGSEAHGVSAGLRASAVSISIPTAGVESLNAAGGGRNPALRSPPSKDATHVSLFDNTPPASPDPKRPLAERMRPRAHGGLHRAGPHPRAGQAAAPADRARRADVDHSVGAAGAWAKPRWRL